MTRLEWYQCDRCRTQFNIKADSNPLTLTENYAASEEGDTKHLCEECATTYHLFWEKKAIHQFDALVKQIIDELYPEEKVVR